MVYRENPQKIPFWEEIKEPISGWCLWARHWIMVYTEQTIFSFLHKLLPFQLQSADTHIGPGDDNLGRYLCPTTSDYISRLRGGVCILFINL